jgi:hypothetical protein
LLEPSAFSRPWKFSANGYGSRFFESVTLPDRFERRQAAIFRVLDAIATFQAGRMMDAHDDGVVGEEFTVALDA